MLLYFLCRTGVIDQVLETNLESAQIQVKLK